MTLEKAGLSVGASAGIGARSTEPVQRADGTWIVQWDSAAGAAAHATGQADHQPSVGGSNGFSTAAVGERSFATREEAEAFREGLLPTELLRRSYSAAEIAALPTGGTIRHDGTTELDTSGELGAR